jgi:hypothetical protein
MILKFEDDGYLYILRGKRKLGDNSKQCAIQERYEEVSMSLNQSHL